MAKSTMSGTVSSTSDVSSNSTGSTVATSMSSITTGSSEIMSKTSSKNNASTVIIIAIAVPVGFVLIVAIVVFLVIRKRKYKPQDKTAEVELATTAIAIPETSPTLNNDSHKKEEEPKNNVRATISRKVNNVLVQERLGGGQFSDVYKGIWMVQYSQIKFLQDLGNNSRSFKTFEKRGSIRRIYERSHNFIVTLFLYFFSLTRSLTHKNVLQFYGIYTSPSNEQYIVTEFLNKGSLRDLLQTEGNKMSQQDLISMYFFFLLATCLFFSVALILLLEWRTLQIAKLFTLI